MTQSRSTLPFRYAAILVVASATFFDAMAQPPPQIPALPPPITTSSAATAPARAPAATADHVALVRATLSALNDANITGNYSVLRDVAAPSFAERHTAADLAIAFTNLRSNPLFSPASLGTPVVTATRQPSADTLVVSGHVAARPANLTFDIQYQRIGARWRLSAIAVSLPQAKSAQASPSR